MENKSLKTVISVSLNVILIVIAIFIVFTVSSKAFSFGNMIFDERSMDLEDNARTVEVTISENMSNGALTDLLYSKGLIKDKTVFKVQIMLSDYNGEYIAGTYTLTTAMTPTEILEAICTETEVEE